MDAKVTKEEFAVVIEFLKEKRSNLSSVVADMLGTSPKVVCYRRQINKKLVRLEKSY